MNLGFLAEDVNLEPIVPAFESVFGQALEMGVSRMDFKAVTDDLSGVMYRFPFQVPPYYALIIRSLVTLEGIALSVDSDFKILGAAYPYFARRLMEDPDPSLRQSLKEMLFDGEVFRWQRLDNLIASAAMGSQLDLDSLLDQVLDFLFSANGGLLRQQLVDAAVQQVDSVAWQTTLRLGKRLPTQLQPLACATSGWSGPRTRCWSSNPSASCWPSCRHCQVLNPSCCCGACPGCWGNPNCGGWASTWPRALPNEASCASCVMCW